MRVDFSSELLSPSLLDRFSFLALVVELEGSDVAKGVRIIDFAPREADLTWPRPDARGASPPGALPPGDALRAGAAEVLAGVRTILAHRNLRRFFGAYLVYEDGVNTVIAFSAILAAQTLGLPIDRLVILYIVGGTILLDEVGETPRPVQAKLLRALQERAVRRVGSRHARRVDVRILAATNEDLASLVPARRFRQDLYHRLHVVALTVPPLRERLADLAPLAHHFLAVHAARAQKTLSFSAEAFARMRKHPWPGNVRELEHAVQRAVVLARGPEIMPDDLGLDGPLDWGRPAMSGPSGVRRAGASPLHREPATALSERERERILAVLERCRGNRRAAAQTLGIDRSTLWRRLRRHTTEPPEFSSSVAPVMRRFDSPGSPEAP